MPARRLDDSDAASALLRALATLGPTAASLALIPCQLSAAWLPGFIVGNRLAAADRGYVVLAVVLAPLAAIAAGAAFVRVRGAGAVARLALVARAASVLSLAGLLPALLMPQAWPDALVGALAIGVFVLAFAPLLRRSLVALAELRAAAPSQERSEPPSPSQTRWRQHAPLVVTALASLLYALYMGHFSILNHRHFNTYSYDLGIYDNQFWQALHGHPFRSTPSLPAGDWSILKIHAEFSMYAFLPFYALHPGAETLLILQTLVIAAGAIPLFRLAARHLSPLLAAMLALAYLLYPPLHGANLYDFHFQPLAVPFVLCTIDFLDEGRNLAAAIPFVIAIGCREDISAGLCCFGIYLALDGKRFRAGVIVAAISAVWFVVVKFVVMPHFGTYWFADMYKQLYPDGERSYGGILKTILSNPWFVFKTLLTGAKLRYALQVLVPFAFLPLRKPILWILLLPGAFFTLLTTEYVASTDIAFQYSCHFVPYLFYSTIVALAQLRATTPRERSTAAAVTLALASLLCTIHWGAIPPRASFHAGFSTVRFAALGPADVEAARHLAELAAMVPFDAKLAVSEAELPHLSARPECYTLRYGHNGADYILYAHGSGHDGSDEAEAAVRAGEYAEVASRPRLTLLKRVRAFSNRAR
jgi:uncharacterized membrane protein